MPVPLRSPHEIEAIARAGQTLWTALSVALDACRPGITTREVAEIARVETLAGGAEPILAGYSSRASSPFPAAACVCVNEEVVHAVPSDRILRAGDVVTVDLAVRYPPGPSGWYADAARTRVVGEAASTTRAALLHTTALAALDMVIDDLRPGRCWSDVANAARGFVARAGCALVAGYSGHGIGRGLHEPPRLSFSSPLERVVFRPGMVVTVEPIVVEGPDPDPPRLVTLDDGWTVLSADRRWAAHEERTVAITSGGRRVLTGPGTDPGRGRERIAAPGGLP